MRLQRRAMPKKLRKVADPVLFYERSLYTDRYIFAKNCAETNLMNGMEWDIYRVLDFFEKIVRTSTFLNYSNAL